MTVFDDIAENYGRFARTVIAGHPELNQSRRFPADIRRQLIKNQIFGLCLPPSYGGQNKNTLLLANAAKILVSESGNMGIAFSWLIHEMISTWLIAKFADNRQKKALLPDLAAGRITVSFAVSEPEIGAHPKHLKTGAVYQNGAWRLTGSKCHITNGPISDWFIIMAKTGTSQGKNQFTAFLVQKDTPGLTRHAATELPFLRPCPHGGISLDNCRISKSWILGPEDHAYDEMAIPFRTIEDALLMSLVSGGIRFELNRLADAAGRSEKKPDQARLTELGRLKCQADAIDALSETAAALLDKPAKHPKLTTLPLFLRTETDSFQRRFKELAANMPAGLTPDTLPVTRDIDGLLGIGRQAAQNRIAKLGEQRLPTV